MANVAGAAGGALTGGASGMAIGGPIGAGIGAVVGGLAGLFGGGGGPDYEKQMEMLQQIQAEIDSIPLPPLEAQQLVLEKYRSAGVLTPEMEAVIQQGPSAMAGITTDPRLKSAQMSALQKLQQVGEEGLTPIEKAQVSDLSRQVAAQQQAQQQSILQNMQQRGIAGGGAELAAQLSSSQAAAERQSQESQNLAAQAYKRALDAIAQGGSLAGNIREQEFGEEAKVASAADEIARFNAANQQNVQSRNIGARNTSQEANLQAAQNLANQNVALSNQQQQYNKQLLQQQFQNQLSKSQAKTGAQQNIANMFGQEGQRADTSFGNLMSGLGTAGGTLAKYYSPKEQYERQAYQQKLDELNKKPTSDLLADYDPNKKYV